MWVKAWRGQGEKCWGLECPRAQAVLFAQVASTSALSLVGTWPPLPCSFLCLSFFHQGDAVNPGLTPFRSKSQSLESGLKG